MAADILFVREVSGVHCDADGGPHITDAKVRAELDLDQREFCESLRDHREEEIAHFLADRTAMLRARRDRLRAHLLFPRLQRVLVQNAIESCASTEWTQPRRVDDPTNVGRDIRFNQTQSRLKHRV